MSRPRIICHMHTLLDGKVDGIANITEVGLRAQREYHALMLGPDRAFSGHRGWLSGRGTSEAILGGPREPDLPESFDPVPEGDFIAQPDADWFYFAVDGSGKLAWDRAGFEYFGAEAHIVALISGAVPEAYKAFLRQQGVSYLIVGEDRLDMGEAVQRIGETFGVDELILGGGPNLNWSMIRQGLVDEISLVLMPTADAEGHTSPLFRSSGDAEPIPVEFAFRSAEPLSDGSVWLRYDVVGEIEES
ncbi:dihydrofolate reductase family protein [Dietzia aurantiaca]|uniref:Dihydrofolate reductase family protein n=1 Tax=Dietzia aurantiaca TaxID=983873 RepID=A0ABV9PVN8_9ACTN